MIQELPVDPDALREEVKLKYRDVATKPDADYHFHTGRPLTVRLGYDQDVVGRLPDAAVESFAGVANPFAVRPLEAGEKVVDAGSGGGFDCFVAAQAVGPTGQVVGVDMLDAMVAKSSQTAADMAGMGFANVRFEEGLLEAMPVADGWADTVMSNGVVNLCADKRGVFDEVLRVLRPGGWFRFADIANGKPVPSGAIANIDLWTA